MCGRRHRQELLLASVLMLCGCQNISSPPRLVNPFAPKSAADGTDVAATPAAPDVLRPEQKADVQIALARGLEHQGRTDEAKKIYLDITKAVPRRADAFHRLALLHDHKGECALAQDYYRQALEREPQNAELHCDCGYSAYLQQHWEDAEKSLRRAIALAPDCTRAHNNLGMLLARTRRDGEALQEFAKAGANEAEARANLALAMTLSNRWTEAQTEYQAALTAAPHLKAAQDGVRIVQAVAANGSGNADFRPSPASASGVSQATYLAPPSAPGR